MQKWEYFDKEIDKRIMEDMSKDINKNRIKALVISAISGMFLAFGTTMLVASIKVRFTGIFGRIDYILVILRGAQG